MATGDELRALLRTRRDRLSPADVGLADERRRRVPGLRREEVARLAGVSVGHYTRLEQGRHVGVSTDVLAAVADALQMPDDERRRLFELVGPSRRSRRPASRSQRVRPSITALLEIVPAPALVVGVRQDVLASNPLARFLLCDFAAVSRSHGNQARWVFLDPGARERYLNWEEVARDRTADLRDYQRRHPDDAALAALVTDLSTGSPEFARWWVDSGDPPRRLRTVRLRHPAVGELALTHEALLVPDGDEQVVHIDLPEPGSPSERALRRLATEAGPRATGSAVHGAADRVSGPHRTDVGVDVAVTDRLVADDRDEG